MAISAPVRAFIQQISGRVDFCHHAVHAISLYAKHGRTRLPVPKKSIDLAESLKAGRAAGQAYDPRTSIVVDEAPPIMLASCDNLRGDINLHPINELIRPDSKLEATIFPAQFIHELIG